MLNKSQVSVVGPLHSLCWSLQFSVLHLQIFVELTPYHLGFSSDRLCLLFSLPTQPPMHDFLHGISWCPKLSYLFVDLFDVKTPHLGSSFQRAGSLSGCLMSSSQTTEAVQCTGLSGWVLCWTEESPWLLLEMTYAWALRPIWYLGQGKIFYLGLIFVTKMNDFIWCFVFPMFPFPLFNKCLQVCCGFHLPCVAEVLGDRTILAGRRGKGVRN